MSVTTAKNKQTAQDFKKAQEHMRVYAQSQKNLKDLMDRIKNEQEVYKKNMKDAEEALLEFGTIYRDQFDEKGNLHFEDGYIHATQNTVINTADDFDLTAFRDEFPEMVEVKMKTSLVKKAFLNADTNKQLREFGVSTDTNEELKLIVNKPEA